MHDFQASWQTGMHKRIARSSHVLVTNSASVDKPAALVRWASRANRRYRTWTLPQVGKPARLRSQEERQLACKTAFWRSLDGASVDKPMYIHRSRCAEQDEFRSAQNLSTIRSICTQALSRTKMTAQVIDLVE